VLAASSRRRLGRDALVSGVVALGMVLGVPTLHRLVAALIPAGQLISGVSWPTGIETPAPYLAALCNAVSASVFIAGLAAIVAGIASRFFKGPATRAVVALLCVVAFLPWSARTPAEYALGALTFAITGGAVLVLVLCFLRDNPLAWLWSAWFALGGNAAIRLIGEPGGAYRIAGIVLAAAILAPGVWLLVTSSRAAPAAAAR
jgi:hypothetical protein